MIFCASVFIPSFGSFLPCRWRQFISFFLSYEGQKGLLNLGSFHKKRGGTRGIVHIFFHFYSSAAEKKNFFGREVGTSYCGEIEMRKNRNKLHDHGTGRSFGEREIHLERFSI